MSSKYEKIKTSQEEFTYNKKIIVQTEYGPAILPDDFVIMPQNLRGWFFPVWVKTGDGYRPAVAWIDNDDPIKISLHGFLPVDGDDSDVETESVGGSYDCDDSGWIYYVVTVHDNLDPKQNWEVTVQSFYKGSKIFTDHGGEPYQFESRPKSVNKMSREQYEKWYFFVTDYLEENFPVPE